MKTGRSTRIIFIWIILFTFGHAPYVQGQFDPTFGTNGKVITLFEGVAGACDAVVQKDGKILVVGLISSPTNPYPEYLLGILRLNSDGSIDKTFADNGYLKSQVGALHCAGNPLALQPDGKIILGGSVYHGDISSMAIVRYLSDGSRDTGFAKQGLWSMELNSNLLPSLSVDEKGRPYLFSLGFSLAHITAIAVRLSVDGHLDLEYGVFGVGRAYFPKDGYVIRKVSFSSYGDGMVYVNLRSLAAFKQFAAKFGKNGLVDTSFGKKGVTEISLPNAIPFLADTYINKDRSALFTGSILKQQGMSLLRVKPNGELDTSFAGKGYLLTPIGKAASAFGVTSLSQGKVLVMGSSALAAVHEPTVVRYSSEGEIDKKFGENGVLRMTMENGFSGYFGKAIELENGKVLLLGGVSSSAQYFLVARLLKEEKT